MPILPRQRITPSVENTHARTDPPKHSGQTSSARIRSGCLWASELVKQRDTHKGLGGGERERELGTHTHTHRKKEDVLQQFFDFSVLANH